MINVKEFTHGSITKSVTLINIFKMAVLSERIDCCEQNEQFFSYIMPSKLHSM
jgi:hypothetical protein